MTNNTEATKINGNNENIKHECSKCIYGDSCTKQLMYAVYMTDNSVGVDIEIPEMANCKDYLDENYDSTYGLTDGELDQYIENDKMDYYNDYINYVDEFN